jgi:hypothetical protein
MLYLNISVNVRTFLELGTGRERRRGSKVRRED